MASNINTQTKKAENMPVLTRIINAPRELVFKAVTDPEMFKQWWGSHGFTTPICKIDLRPGGKILFC